MKPLGSLFTRYQALLVPPQASVEKRVAAIICELTPLTITSAQITYSVASRTITLKVPSIIKSELQHYKMLILERLQQEMGAKNAPTTIL